MCLQMAVQMVKHNEWALTVIRGITIHDYEELGRALSLIKIVISFQFSEHIVLEK
jgi:hypothetical protein